MSTLQDVFNFSHSSDFDQYQKWFLMEERKSSDPDIQLSSEEVSSLQDWPSVQNIYEHVLPSAVLALSTYEYAFKDEFQKYEKAVKDLENQNKLFEFYKSVLDRLTKLYLDSLSGMLSEVYQEVYGTHDKHIQLEMVDFRNKKIIRLNVINNINGHDYVEDFGAEGGAARIILGIVVSIYFILTVGAPRILFIDECLSALFPETNNRFMRILKQFVDQLGFVIVVIDHHKDRFEEFVDKVYSVESGVYKQVSKEVFYSFVGV